MTIDTQSPDFLAIRDGFKGPGFEGDRQFVIASQIASLIDQEIGRLTYSPRGKFAPALDAAFMTLSVYQENDPLQCPPRAVRGVVDILSSPAWSRSHDFNEWRESRLEG